MNKILLVTACLILAGCATVSIQKGDCKAAGTAFFMSASAIQSKACGGSLGATDTGENMSSIVSAAVSAAVNSATVTP